MDDDDSSPLKLADSVIFAWYIMYKVWKIESRACNTYGRKKKTYMYVRVLVSRAELSRELVHSTLLQIRLARHCFSLSPRATKKKPVERLPHSLAVAYHVRLPVKITHYRHLARILISLSLFLYSIALCIIHRRVEKLTVKRERARGARSIAILGTGLALSPLFSLHTTALRGGGIGEKWATA